MRAQGPCTCMMLQHSDWKKKKLCAQSSDPSLASLTPTPTSTPTKKVRVSVEDLENVNPIEMHPERHVQSAVDELKRKNPGLRSLCLGVGKLSFSPRKKLRDVNDGASVDFKAKPGLKGGMDGAATEDPGAAEEICVICQYPLSTGETYPLPCEHVLHAMCAADWFREGQNGRCPLCNDAPPPPPGAYQDDAAVAAQLAAQPANGEGVGGGGGSSVVCDVCLAGHSDPPNEILLCDLPFCNKARHMQCCEQRFSHVPAGNWFCSNDHQQIYDFLSRHRDGVGDDGSDNDDSEGGDNENQTPGPDVGPGSLPYWH